MNCIEWNNHIAKHFFNSKNAGKNIHLYITKQEIINLARGNFSEKDDCEIWADFITKLKNGLPDSNKFPDIFDKAIHSLEQWKRQGHKTKEGVTLKYPPFISYLVFSILPLIEIQGDYKANNYYDRLSKFLDDNHIKQDLRNKLIKIDDLWQKLSFWANNSKNGELGLFKSVQFINTTWKYVGKPFSQCILPPKSIRKLPEFFYFSGLVPKSNYQSDVFKDHLLKNGGLILGLNTSVIELIKKGEKDEIGQSIIDIIKREYYNWNGESHLINSDGERTKTKRNNTVVPLFSQFKVNQNSGLISFSYRLYSSNDYPEDLKFAQYEDLYETNGWSKTLNFDFKEPFDLQDSFNKWVAKFPTKDIRLYISAGTFQLSTDYWLETNLLSKTDTMFLLCKPEKKQSIIEWGETFRHGNFHEEDFEGLPENYSLFKILNPTTSHPDISLLTIFNEKRIELIDGLKVNFRTYIDDYLPELEITNSDGNEKVYLQYRNIEGKIFLIKKESNSNRWLLPDETKLNFDFYIKAEGENFAGNEIAYNITSSKDSALKVDGLQLPKRDTFGKQTSIESNQYCLGSNVINPTKASQRYYSAWENLFINNIEDFAIQFKNVFYNHHCGNMLASFLTLKNVLTTEEFFRAFEFYHSKGFTERQASESFNLSRVKKAALDFYDYIGILDYDYETKLIVVNPPQLIFIPTDQGRKVLLIGGRDVALLNIILESAPKHDLQVEITRQFSSNERLLLPDVITIKAFGKRTEGFGERNIVSFAKEIGLEFSQNDFIQLSLSNFSANIKDYEKELIANEETSEVDYDWARRIFNPYNLTYERNESTTFDKSFSLIEYKLNEYTYYNKLWKEGKCYSVDKNWGKYLALKQINRHIILFDRNRNRVAIPVETPLPRLISESIMLLSGLAPDFRIIDGKYYRVYENIPGIFTENLFQKLGQKPNNQNL